MIEVKICVGSSCHLKGAYEVVERLKVLIEKEKLSAKVVLGASFCQGRCTEGIIVKFDDKLLTHISPNNIEEKFNQYLKGEI